MYSYEDRLRVVQFYIKLDKRIGLTIRVEFGERVSQPRPMTLTVRTLSCPRRSKSEPPRRLNIEPGVEADFERVGCG